MKTIFLICSIFLSAALAQENIIILNGAQDSNISEILLKVKKEECKASIQRNGSVEETDCIQITNSKKVKILCTPNKRLCKTVNEIILFAFDTIDQKIDTCKKPEHLKNIDIKTFTFEKKKELIQKNMQEWDRYDQCITKYVQSKKNNYEIYWLIRDKYECQEGFKYAFHETEEWNGRLIREIKLYSLEGNCIANDLKRKKIFLDRLFNSTATPESITISAKLAQKKWEDYILTKCNMKEEVYHPYDIMEKETCMLELTTQRINYVYSHYCENNKQDGFVTCTP